MSGMFQSSISRKYWMAASGFFLIVFLTQHFVINFLSVINPCAFNEVSHFMGTNALIQFLMQPILIAGVVLHFVLGFALNMQNMKARSIKYAKTDAAASSPFVSRYMILSGGVLFWFLALHFYDFWIPEISTKYIYGDMSGLDAAGDYRYYEELVHKFASPARVALYVVAFVFLMLHLLHGFQSAFQSAGLRHARYTPIIKKVGNLYAVVISLGFIFIAIYHFLAHA